MLKGRVFSIVAKDGQIAATQTLRGKNRSKCARISNSEEYIAHATSLPPFWLVYYQGVKTYPANEVRKDMVRAVIGIVIVHSSNIADELDERHSFN
jgi:hypothetical protein